MDQQISLCLGGDLANLHCLGWISTDVHRLIELSDLLDTGQQARLERYFGTQARSYNRYKAFTDNKHRLPTEIGLLEDGSLEVKIPNLSVAAAIVMPLVQTAVMHRLKNGKTPVEFRLTPKDPGLKRVMQAYERGDFGEGSEGLNTLAFVLDELKYDVTFLAESADIIENAVTRYSARIARTIRKHSK